MSRRKSVNLVLLGLVAGAIASSCYTKQIPQAIPASRKNSGAIANAQAGSAASGSLPIRTGSPISSAELAEMDAEGIRRIVPLSSTLEQAQSLLWANGIPFTEQRRDWELFLSINVNRWAITVVVDADELVTKIFGFWDNSTSLNRAGFEPTQGKIAAEQGLDHVRQRLGPPNLTLRTEGFEWKGDHVAFSVGQKASGWWWSHELWERSSRDLRLESLRWGMTAQMAQKRLLNAGYGPDQTQPISTSRPNEIINMAKWRGERWLRLEFAPREGLISVGLGLATDPSSAKQRENQLRKQLGNPTETTESVKYHWDDLTVVTISHSEPSNDWQIYQKFGYCFGDSLGE